MEATWIWGDKSAVLFVVWVNDVSFIPCKTLKDFLKVSLVSFPM